MARLRPSLPLLLALLLLGARPSLGAAPLCRGDCDGDGGVAPAEVTASVDIALRGQGACNGVAPLTVEQLVAAVDNSMQGCPSDLCERIPASAFDDHTRGCLASPADFFALAIDENGRAATKFLITNFREPRARAMRYYESDFYALHDEWYWFRLLNGERVPGETVPPLKNISFATIAEIYAWATSRAELPLDLAFFESRLYSSRFYRLSLEDPRQFGLGTLLYIAPREGRAERWLFQLEYVDSVTHAQLVLFFETLAATLPAEIGEHIGWLVRSPDQEQLAREMENEHLAYGDRIVRFADLAVPGETEVYSAGLTAGRLRIVELAAGSLPSVAEDDLLVLDQVPDALPLVAGLLTAVPQTPLAHLNLLARSRRIPNAYRAGIFDDPFVQQLGGSRAPVALRAREPDGLDLVPLTEAEYTTWRQLRSLAPIGVAQVDLANAPYVIDLRQLSLADVDMLRPLIGGKSAGFLALLAVDGVTTPDLPMAVTIRAYAEHVASLRPAIVEMLADASFNADVRIRYLVLEGIEAYQERYPPGLDQGARDAFLATHVRGNKVGDLARDGGLKGVIRAKRMAAAPLAAIQTALASQFDSFAVKQALRFRSSSTVEDIEGFVGAGLYTSNSGFLDAAAQPAAKDRLLTVERALKDTWASYWNAAAFEERRAQRIDHLSGNMGVTVHARFDDEKEAANAVLTFTIAPAVDEFSGILDVNVQSGATSVTNPTAGSNVLPEVDRVRRRRDDDTLVIDRLRPSTLVPVGQFVLGNEELLALYAQTEQVTAAWRAQRNAPLTAAQAAETVVLDFELRHTAAGWPSLKEGTPFPSRLILKQARSLDPGLRRISAELQAAPVPRDVLAHAKRVEERTCVAPAFRATLIEVYTDPLIPPDLRHDVVPFTASARFEISGDIVETTHLDFATVAHPGLETGGAWSIDVALVPARALTTFHLDAAGEYRLESDAEILAGSDATCSARLLHASPEGYLASLIDD